MRLSVVLDGEQQLIRPRSVRVRRPHVSRPSARPGPAQPGSPRVSPQTVTRIGRALRPRVRSESASDSPPHLQALCGPQKVNLNLSCEPGGEAPGPIGYSPG